MTMPFHRHRTLFAAFGLFLGYSGEICAQKIYWSDHDGRVQRANLDGSDYELLARRLLQEPFAVAVHNSDGKVYWTDNAGDKIQRANLDGTDAEDVVTGLFLSSDRPSGIAIDPTGNKVYWVSFSNPTIFRANLDGSDIEPVVGTGFFVMGLAIDQHNHRIYWTCPNGDLIVHSNLDGSDKREIALPPDGQPWGVAVDWRNGYLYWTDIIQGLIFRSSLDGSNAKVIVEGLHEPRAITVAPKKGKIYFGHGEGHSHIWQANLDGSGVVEILTTAVDPRGLAVSREGLLVADPGGHKILFAYQEQSVWTMDPIVRNPVYRPSKIALDPFAGLIYWVDRRFGRIQRCRWDGSRLETIARSNSLVPTLAIDRRHGLLYWARSLSRDIFETDLDTLEERRLPSPGWSPSVRNLAVDPDTDTLYATDDIFDAIIRTNTSGVFPDIFAENGDRLPSDIVFNGAQQTLYWALGDNIERRAVGSDETELVIATDARIDSIAIDERAERIYWWDQDSGMLKEADLDGNDERSLFAVDSLLLVAIDVRAFGDLNEDGGVDLRDFASFSNCVSREEGDAACLFFDSPPFDSLIDVADLPRVQEAMTGPVQ